MMVKFPARSRVIIASLDVTSERYIASATMRAMVGKTFTTHGTSYDGRGFEYVYINGWYFAVEDLVPEGNRLNAYYRNGRWLLIDKMQPGTLRACIKELVDNPGGFQAMKIVSLKRVLKEKELAKGEHDAVK